MTVIPFRSKTVEPCPGFCQLPSGHPFLRDETQAPSPFREHTATFGDAHAIRIEYRILDEDGEEASAWDGQPDLPEIDHEAMMRNPWTLGDAQRLARDMAAMAQHIGKHLEHQDGDAS